MQIRLWIFAVVLAAALGLAHLIGVFSPLDAQILDMRFKLRGGSDIHPDIALMVIGDDDFREFGPWPLPNQLMSQYVEAMDSLKVRALVLDAIFSRPTAGKGDAQFRQAVREYGKVFFPLRFSPYAEAIALTDSSVSPKIIRHSLEQLAAGRYIIPMRGLQTLLLPGLDTVAKSLGFVHVSPDEDGVVRRTPLLLSSNDMVFPHLGLQVWGRNTMTDFRKLNLRSGMLGLGSRELIPLDGGGNMIINWPGKWDELPKWSFGRVLRSMRSIKAGKEPEMPLDSLKMLQGKIILLGPVDRTSYEFVATPLEKQHPILGMDFAILNSIFTHNPIRTASYQIVILLLLLLGLFSAWLFQNRTGLWAIVAMGAILVFIGLSQFLFSSWDVDLPITAMLLNTLILGFWNNITTQHRERIEKQKVENMFARYMTQEVADDILNSGGESRRADVTVLFSDIRGFTAISESMQAVDVVAQLNEYFETMTPIITNNHGFIDKFVGDGIMAYFDNEEIPGPHALWAVKCGIDMQKAVAQLNARWESQGRRTFEIGVGINTGQVIKGNIGTDKYMDFTLIGDSVNLASRLCSIANPSELLISPSTYQEVYRRISVRNSREMQVKGKQKPVRVYAVGELLERENKEKRRFERFVISLPIELRIGEHKRETAWLIDLSAGGFCCIARETWRAGDIVHTSIILPNGIEIRSAEARIVDASIIEEGVRIKAEYTTIDETEREEIVKMALTFSDEGNIA